MKNERLKLKKYLGQHFLKDRNIIRKIVDSLDIKAGDTVVEIGPGGGALTKELVERKPKRLICVEIDDEMIDYLKETFRDCSFVEIVKGDAVKFDFSKCGNRIKVVGNLPYNVSTAIIRNLLDYKSILERAVFMTQKEVAERLISRKGKNYGYLPALLQNFFEIKKLFDVSPKVFTPPPKVWSTVFKMIPKDFSLDKEELEQFEKFLKKAFSGRRKKLKNTLGIELLEISDILSLRPEDVSPEEFYRLFTTFKQKNII
ncbi:16S rRNA (adenine(1518)-N(6)/adenine(1519)-N(6))-dimethyltransferase RsmA [Desulfurobacterium atlanticum]|uniref:Ribosomal RNA small subunit methyltransferase A n=1 Tax=Desulfurobacterium atlanticum TaxID=240169 RepID=A0A238Y7B4_9BACT|nr:16S rRNA (adenine(1518)-N(6)/adenine(1519)-N(6))-dimethyltransferase RsmA [Desulfurobacterium atlanticum]SNR66681.1 16S rRNA (adenine1518-N6/adenine1519-N6)-dimethyltransferase [Desulfurobacterium atlanticum]